MECNTLGRLEPGPGKHSSLKKIEEQGLQRILGSMKVQRPRRGVRCREGPGCESMVIGCHLHETRAYCAVAMGA